MNTHFFAIGIEIMKKLESAGYEAYIVGGAVRDHVFKRNIHDIDLTTSAPVEVVKRLFPKTIDVAIKHGTIIVFHCGQSFEVTSFRGNSLVEDLLHRDFTINAMALTSQGEIVDPFFGQEDLRKQMIRGVKHASDRFQEDPLRMLRAIRFVSELSFSLEATTMEAIKTQRDLICHVAIERIFSELTKIWFGNDVKKSLEYFQQSKLLETIEPLRPIYQPLTEPKIVTAISGLSNITEVWTLLLYATSHRQPRVFLQQWKQPKKIIIEVETLLSRLPVIVKQGFRAEDLYHFGLQLSQQAERVRAAIVQEKAKLDVVTDQFAALPIKSKQQLTINGQEIKRLLHKEEPLCRIGELLSRVERAIVTRQVENNKQAIINWLREEGAIRAQ